VLVRLRKEFDENEVAIHGLSIDEDSTALSLFVKRMDMNYPVALASETAQQVFHVNSIPMTLIYDKKGALITARQGLLSYESLQYALQTLSEAN
jgi:thioredoxin-related protein